MFIGELGASPNNKVDPTGRWLCESIDAMEAEKVSLMALWVWHFPWQPELTMTTYSSRILNNTHGEDGPRDALAKKIQQCLMFVSVRPRMGEVIGL